MMLNDTISNILGEAKGETPAIETIAVFDIETDPFDNDNPDKLIYPFLGVIYYIHEGEPVTKTILNEDFTGWLAETIDALKVIPGKRTIYAHNGGRFDYKFLLDAVTGKFMANGKRLIQFKLGRHVCRDSLMILPVSLASINKDAIDYALFEDGARQNHYPEIIRYCISDCKYAFDAIWRFLVDHPGNPISIGAAAITKLQELYKYERIPCKSVDRMLRKFFIGGRTETIGGTGVYDIPLKHYDVNSMYPAVMAQFRHPIGIEWNVGSRITDNTWFIHLKCRSRGALMHIDPETGELGGLHGFGECLTTIHEYDMATRYGLISDVEIIQTYSCGLSTDFRNFVEPLYKKRHEFKRLLDNPDLTGFARDELEAKSLHVKLLLNNAYGKFGQNPEKFFDHVAMDEGKEPKGDGWEEYMICPGGRRFWRKPNERLKYHNVATAASITGAARALLMEAIHLAENPVYCDTDSLVCSALPIAANNNELGAWKLEAEYSQFIAAGKKLYGATQLNGKTKTKAKGARSMSYGDMRIVADGGAVRNVARGATIVSSSEQYYVTRTIRRTGKLTEQRNHEKTNGVFAVTTPNPDHLLRARVVL